MVNMGNLKRGYHKLIQREFEKYRERKQIKDIYLTKDDFGELELSEQLTQELINEEYLLHLGSGKYRTLHMDVAFRAADIRIKYGGTKYTLETNLDIKKRPIIYPNYVEFSKENDRYDKLFESINSHLKNEDLTSSFLRALQKAGISGLTSHQYKSIIEILQKNKDAVLQAPTGFGKTYNFIIPVLVECLKNSDYKGNLSTLFYPRKSLGADQMSKFIKLVYWINKECNANITIGIDDGDTKKMENGVLFRGIKCPNHSDESLLIKNNKPYCEKCNQHFNFIPAIKHHIRRRNPPNILITNIWAYQYKLADNKFWKNGYISKNIKFFVFDEAHAYRSLVAGIVRYLLQIIKSLVSPESRFILSSATIPKRKKFIQKMTGFSLEDMLDLSYDERIHGKDSEKTELYLLVGVNPYTSWETYTHQLATYLSTVNRLKSNKNLQSLIFVDSIKNINRLYSQTAETINLGDPKDHLNKEIPPENAFCYWIYNSDYRYSPHNLESKNGEIQELRNNILENIDYHYADRPDRIDIEEKITNSNLDVVYSTSTLELGVDYENTSVIVNTGMPFSLESVVQRVGRAGRNQKTTLHTSLSVIVVRNNPLEYYHLYRGIENLINVDKLPEIPISNNNHFVIFFSMLFYTVAKLAKNGEKFERESNKNLNKVIKYLDSNKGEVFENLKVNEDISSTENELKKIVKEINRNNIDEKCKKVQASINKKRIQKKSNELNKGLKETIDNLEAKKGDISQREIKYLNPALQRLQSLNDEFETNEPNQDIIDKILDELSEIEKVSRRSKIQPLYEEGKNIMSSLYLQFRELGEDLSEKETINLENFDEDYGTIARACELIQKIKGDPGQAWTIVKNIENLVGFKFMGTSFIDQPITVGFEGESGKEEFLTNTIYRIPPFELVNIPFESKKQREISNSVGARHFWLLNPKKKYLITDDNKLGKQFWSSLKENNLAKGSSTHFVDLSIPEKIEFIDALSMSPIVIKIFTNTGPLYIKYGSENIVDSLIQGKYPIKRNISNLYDCSENSKKFATIKSATMDKIQKLEEKVKEKGNRWGLNLRYTSGCLLGYCLSTDPFDMKCPAKVQEDCQICDGKNLWNRKRKIFPKFFTRAEVGNIPDMKQSLASNISSITYNQLKDDVEFIYDKVNVSMPIKFNDYRTRSFDIEPIGYRAKTSFSRLNINEELINLIIDKIIKINPQLLALLKYKYFLYKSRENTSPFDVPLKTFNYNSEGIDENTEDFRRFLKTSIIHTLSHLFFIYVASEKIKIDPSRLLYYFDENNNVYLFENSKNDGIGAIETIKNEMDKKGSKLFLESFYKWSEDFIQGHNERIDMLEKGLKKESKDYIEKIKEKNKDIVNLENKINSINEKISLNVPLKYVDFITYRQILTNEMLKEITKETSEYLLTLINAQEHTKVCVDGCDNCLILPRGCLELFAQNYVISKTLIKEFLQYLRNKNLSLAGNGLGKTLINLMEYADNIVIKSPFIDDYSIDLINKLSHENKKITLITKESNKEKIKELIGKKNIVIKFQKDFHSKIYYLKKDDEKLMIKGSLNFYYRSLYENEENIDITWDENQIRSMKKYIE